MNHSEILHNPGVSRMKSILPGVVVAVLAAAVIGLGPVWLISDGSLKTVAAITMLVVPLCLVLAVAKARALDAARTTFLLGLLVWWFLLISDKLFDRISEVANTYEGQFSVDAYGEVFVWVVSLLVLALISLSKPEYLGKMFTGSFKWFSLFVLSCVVASTYSPSPSYSLGWSFKLVVTALVLGLCTSCMEKMSDVTAMLWSTMWALLFVCVLAVAEAAADPLTMFQGVGGRLNADPVVLSGSAGCLVIITLILNALHPRVWIKLIAAVGFMIMIVSFGKSGILATVIAATVFLLFRKNLASSVGLLGGMGVLAAILMTTVSPVAKYFTGYQGGSTLTGRTEIWQMGLDVIRRHPWFGNGYLSAKFMWTMERGPLADVGHLHNGFLEALYNNGVVGLIFLIGIHAAILANLFYAKKTVRTYQKAGGSDQANTLIVGCFALYLDLFIYGLVTPAFGGRPTVHFMVFLSILGLSMALRKFAQQVEEQPAKPVRTVALWQERFPAPSPGSI